MTPSTNGLLHDPQVCGLDEDACPGCHDEWRDQNRAAIRHTLDDMANHWKMPADDFATILAGELEHILVNGRFAEKLAKELRKLEIKEILRRFGFKILKNNEGKWVLLGEQKKVRLVVWDLAKEYRELNQ